MKEEKNLESLKEDDRVELRMYNYSDGTEIGAKVDDLQVKAFNLWSRLFDRSEDINLMKEEIGNFLLEVYYCKK